jgi:polar amino acid transport system substrate-binding protein
MNPFARNNLFARSVAVAAIVLGAFAVHVVPVAAADPPVLRWAGDPEGGAPFVEADPTDPNRLVGFDVEIAELIARRLGRTPRFVLVAFASLDQSIARGDADIALSGIEDTRARRALLSSTIPYYEFREVLAVRNEDASRIHGLSDLRGRKVATLGGTIAYEILLGAEREFGLQPVSYDDDVHPYQDLVLGRVDAVLLDNVLADRRRRTIQGFSVIPQSMATGHYVAVLSTRNAALRDTVDNILREAMRNGALERIFRKWNVWSDDQRALYDRLIARQTVEPMTVTAGAGGRDIGRGALDQLGAGQPDAAQPGAGQPEVSRQASVDAAPSASAGRDTSQWAAARRYLPALLKASVVTIVLSFLAMALAVALGVLIASGRVYGNRLLRTALVGYVELVRGTPVLLQLFVLYYGIASAVRLPAFLAALVGLALNYAAYESEIYRGALEAVPSGQIDAARILGLSERQVLTLVRGPQAFRLALAPMTNDFVALLKDSSLVSVLTVMELTKQTQIFATNIGSWVLPGSMCAGLYLAMSLPIAALARRLEEKWKAPTQ